MGKYIHLFQTKEEFNQAVEDTYTEPWVSYTKENDKVDYYKTEYEYKCKQYFTIEATQGGTTVYFRQSNYAADGGLDPLKVEVSTDDGKTWTEVTAAPAEDDVPGATLAELNSGDKVLVRGRNEAYGYYLETKHEGVQNCNFFADAPCYVYGNIMSLIGGDDFARLRKVKKYAFPYFFYSNYADYSWVLSKDDDELLLPATTLGENCYQDMFRHCTGLTTAPELPATTLADYCYNYMFTYCSGLVTAPYLPATTLAYSCYRHMFSHCTNLINVQKKLPATDLADRCYGSMFKDCPKLEVAPELPATVLTSQCYNSMFWECTNLRKAPELPALTLVYKCYEALFADCPNVTHIKAMFTTEPGAQYTQDWVNNVSPNGTFVKNSAATWNVTGIHGVPSGWTVETADA